jgi:ribosome-associated protein
VAPRSYAAGEPGTETDEALDLRSRTDARHEQKQTEEALMRLARRLVELPPRTLARLELPEDVLDVTERARLVRDPGPKNRALRLVRMALRDADVGAIERQLEEVHEAPRGPAPEDDVGRWRTRLLSGAEEALNELVARHPGTDRQKLRNLVRNALRARDGGRARTLAALDAAVRDSIRQ